MGKKLALNVLYNIGIILCLICTYWSFLHGFYIYIFVALFVLIMFLGLKIKLIKEIKEATKKP